MSSDAQPRCGGVFNGTGHRGPGSRNARNPRPLSPDASLSFGEKIVNIHILPRWAKKTLGARDR